MNRRSFLRMLGLAPVAGVAAAVGVSAYASGGYLPAPPADVPLFDPRKHTYGADPFFHEGDVVEWRGKRWRVDRPIIIED